MATFTDHPSGVLFTEKYPVVTRTYKDYKNLNPLLEQVIRKQGDRVFRKSNVKAQMTEWQMNKESGGEHFQKISDFACEVSIDISPVTILPRVNDIWGAVYRKGDYTIPHEHWPALWSFCYYVNVSEKCSPLLFTSNNYQIKPENGMLVLFPGFVKHEVPIQQCDYERVMIAGNITLVDTL
jgi:hypothetical protein